LKSEQKPPIIYPSLQPEYQQEEDDSVFADEYIPIKARDFYHDFGHLTHPKTGRPIEDLTDYQYQVWDDKSKYRLVIKSQKIGLSTSCLLEDFQKALTTCRSKDILLIAQTQDQANEHLLTLKIMIINSPKYRKYLITEANEMLFREEKTKLNTIFIKNPDNPRNRTRIIGKGPSEAALWSWKNVGHIHMSDIAANKLKDDSPVFAAAFSRLASTNGTFLIETPPRGPFKKTFEIYQQSLAEQKNPERPSSMFSIHHISAQQAVNHGVIDQDFLNDERQRLGPTLYAQNYETEFIAVSGNLFNQASIDQAVNTPYLPYFHEAQKYIMADIGYVKSKFAIIVAQYRSSPVKRMQIILAEEEELPTYESMRDKILYYRKKYGNTQNIGVDATSRQEFVMSLKERIDEPSRWSLIKERLDYAKKYGIHPGRIMKVVPFIFTQDSKAFMSSHARRVLDDPRRLVAIDKKHVNLISGLRTAVFDEKGQLDKEQTAHDDLVDCFQMLMTFITYQT